MTASCPTPDPLRPAPVEPRTPLAGPPGFTVRTSHVDGTINLEADLGVEVGRLVDKLVLHARPGQIVTDAEAVGRRLRLTITPPAQ